MIKRYIGDKAFYRRVLAIALPIIIQNGISSFVSLLDNIMVGQIGTLQMSGVSIANQLIFVFNLCIFGACSGAGIFIAQFFGRSDHVGVRDAFRFKLLICTVLTLVGIALFSLAGMPLIRLYLQGDGDPKDAALTLGYGLSYLRIMVIGLLPFALSNAYSSTLRETGQTVVPMVAGICAILVNLSLNYVLIFGHFGAPKMGVQGAALATVISRFAELAIVAIWTHRNPKKNLFVLRLYHSFAIPWKLCLQILRKGMPLLLNEFLWASGMAVINQCYSTCSLDVVPAMNISSTLYNLGSVVFLALGNSVGIILGQMLGADRKKQELLDTCRKLSALSAVSGILFGGIIAAISGLFPQIYNTDPAVRQLATALICISACAMPFNAYTNAAYFTLRSGGKTVVTFLFDSCFMWGICVSLAFILSRFSAITIIPLYIICQSTDLIKSFIGWYMIRKGTWIQNLTNIEKLPE